MYRVRMIRRNLWSGLRTVVRRVETVTAATDEPSTSKSTPTYQTMPPNVSFTDTVKRSYSQQIETLNGKIIAHHRMHMNEEPQEFRNQLVHHLNSTVLRHCRLIPVGSSATGISGITCRSSDLDLSVFPTNPQTRDKFLDDFVRNGDFRSDFMLKFSELISRAIRDLGVDLEAPLVLCNIKVPMMIYHLRNGLKVDIQFPGRNFHAIRNTHLVRMYCSLDPRMPQLYSWLNSLCEAMEIKHSKLGLLSSYHLICLLIHFLQSEQVLSPWPILPVLCKRHPHLFDKGVPIDEVVSLLDRPVVPIEWKSNNNTSVAELAVRFIDYYSQYDARDVAIDIDRGMTVRKRQKHVNPPLLLIFDPYARESVCLHPFVSTALYDAMNFVKRKFKIGEMIESFPNFPEHEDFRMETKWSTWRVKRNERHAFLEHERRRRNGEATTTEDTTHEEESPDSEQVL